MNTNELQPLTKENAHLVATIINVQTPEYGEWKFNHKAQPLVDNEYADIIGVGPDSKVLFEGEYRFWAVSSFKY